jgi:hypothetical protein
MCTLRAQTFSRTSGSSIAARFSRGESSTWANSGPPTKSTNLPNSSLNCVRTSSSSSTDSATCVSPFRTLASIQSLHTVQERYKLLPRPFSAQREGYGVQALDRIQSQHNVIVLQLVDKDGDRVELVVLIRLHRVQRAVRPGRASSRPGAVLRGSVKE